MFISDIGLPDESVEAEDSSRTTAKHSGAAQTKRLASFWKQQQEAHSRPSHPVGLLPGILQLKLSVLEPAEVKQNRNIFRRGDANNGARIRRFSARW